MSNAILVRVTTDIEIMGERATALWIVATTDPETAVRAVSQIVSATCIVEAVDTPVSDSVIERYKIAPGQAWHI